MKRLSFVMLLLSCSAWAQAPLQESLETILNKYKLPSLSAAILLDGEIKEIASVGIRKVGYETKVTTDDKFHLGSCTKSMTATLIAMFVEEGKIKWESTLTEIFPEFEIHDEYKNVTVEMLFTHRSGMVRGIPQYEEIKEAIEKSKSVIEDREIVTKHVLKKAPPIKPNTVDNYSNMAYVVVGHALEKITKKSWEELIDERLFKPLGMNGCGHGETSSEYEDIPSQPWGHFKNIETDELIAEQLDNRRMWGPAGRVHCPIRDWAKYIQLHIDGYHGKASLLKSASFKKLQEVSPYSQMDYTAGGWFQLKRAWANDMALTHGGTNLANYASVWIAPTKKAAIMATTNMGGDHHFTGTDETLNQTAYAIDEALVSLIDKYLRDSTLKK